MIDIKFKCHTKIDYNVAFIDGLAVLDNYLRMFESPIDDLAFYYLQETMWFVQCNQKSLLSFSNLCLIEP